MLPQYKEFIKQLQSNNYSKHTIYNYTRDLETFQQFAGDRKINRQLIDDYKAYLTSEDRHSLGGMVTTKLAPKSVNRMLSSVRSYLRYIAGHGYRLSFSWEGIENVRTGQKKKQAPPLDELRKLAEAPTKLEKKLRVRLRNRAILELLLATGMRISELVGLDQTDVDPNGRILVRGKGRKERFVFMTDRSWEHLKAYLKIRSDTGSALFVPHIRIRNKPENRLTTSYVSKKIIEYRKKLGLTNLTAHSFRHGYATYMVENGASPVAVQTLLGHESLTTTSGYLHTSDKFALDNHRRYHPLSSNREVVI